MKFTLQTLILFKTRKDERLDKEQSIYVSVTLVNCKISCIIRYFNFVELSNIIKYNFVFTHHYLHQIKFSPTKNFAVVRALVLCNLCLPPAVCTQLRTDKLSR